MSGEYPSSVVFTVLKKLGVSHVDTARMLYDVEYSYGGLPLGERFSRRSELSRFFIRVVPGTYSRRFFNEFGQSAQNVCARLFSRSKVSDKPDALALLIEYFSGDAALRMQRALDSCGIERAPYSNSLKRISHNEELSENDALLLYVMLFIATGCLGDAEEAVRDVEAFARDFLSADVLTPSAWTDSTFEGPEDYSYKDCTLGIIRVFDGMTLRSGHGLHVLTEGPAGTTIGLVGCDITDVDEWVSREHARIFNVDDKWYVEGLGSTNGTAVISGSDGSVCVVEPPRSKRPRGFKSEPYPLKPADTICLGRTTRFLVQMVSK